MFARIAELHETDTGGLYAVVEVRHDPSDLDPFHVEDFIWNRPPPEALDVDEFGRVEIGGRRRWPFEELNGRRHPRDVSRAKTVPSELSDRLLEEVLGHMNIVGFDNPGDRRLPPEKRPAFAAGQRGEVMSAAAKLRGVDHGAGELAAIRARIGRGRSEN